MDAISLLNSFIDLSFGNPLVQSVLVGAVRSVAGWAQASLEDGQISRFEIGQLFSTMMRVIPQSLGLSALGVPAVGALFSDVFVTKLAKVASNGSTPAKK